MVFWLSVLVFIAGIMTYMFFPRSDQYQLNVYQEEGNVVTFVNQHQAAKDLMYQMISWNPDTGMGIYALPYAETNVGGQGYLESSIPRIMTEQDVYTKEGQTSLTPEPTSDSGGSYTSAIVCLDDCSTEANCVQGKMLTQCPSKEQYVITYGIFPEWWRDGTHRKQAWFRSLLKRAHGSTVCGVLTDRGVFGGNRVYSINNSQRFSGYQVLASKRVVPPALTNKLAENRPNGAGIDTCEPKGSCSDRLNDLLFCMTAFPNPYRGSPIFHWDSVNNNKTAHQAGLGLPLIGNLQNSSDIAVSGVLPTDTYTFAGTVIKASGEKTLIRLNDLSTLEQVCGTDSCQLRVLVNGVDSVAVAGIPLDKGYSFSFVSSPASENKQTLTVYYNQYVDSAGNAVVKANPADPWPDGIKKEVKHISESNTVSDGPVLNTPRLIIDGSGNFTVNDLRLYNTPLNDRDSLYNAKVDLKRFGL